MRNSILMFTIIAILAIIECQSATQNHIRENRTERKNVHPRKVRERKNKAIVVDFYQRVFGDQDFGAIDEYIGDVYIQHSPTVADGKEALKKAVRIWLKDEPKKKVDIKRTVAEGNFVWLHLRNNLQGNDSAFVDIYRLKKGKIVEHWDVIQPVPPTSPNNNTMF